MSGSRGRPVVVVDPDTASTVTIDELRLALSRVVDPDRVDWVDTTVPTDTDDRHGTSAFERGRAAAATAVAAGAPTVIACGDDTTVRSCVEAVAGTSATLGIVSLGPGTLLASNLSIAPGLDAVPGAIEGTPRRLDVGEVNGEVFAAMAGFGVEAMLGRGDRPVTAAEVFSVLRSLPRRLVPVTVHVDGVQRFSGRTACLLVANCAGGPGRSTVVPGADPTDAALDLAVVSPRYAVEWPMVLWRLVTGQPQRPEDVVRCRGEWIHVQTWRPRPYELDGDPRPPASKLDVRVWADALSVRAPEVVHDPVDPATNGDVGLESESEVTGSEFVESEATDSESEVADPEPEVAEPEVPNRPVGEPLAPSRGAGGSGGSRGSGGNSKRLAASRKPTARQPSRSSSRTPSRPTGSGSSARRGRVATEDSDPSTN